VLFVAPAVVWRREASANHVHMITGLVFCVVFFLLLPLRNVTSDFPQSAMDLDVKCSFLFFIFI